MAKVIDFGKRPPGRPTKVAPAPSERVRARIEAYEKAAAEHTEKDPLVRASAEPASLETLYLTREEIAREAAGALWMRMNSTPGSRERRRASARRVSALSEVAQLTLKIAKVTAGEASPATLRLVLDALQREVEDAAREVFDAGTADRLTIAIRCRLVASSVGD
jgi:glycerol-3-phosphate dehydrogenase